jgi:DNA-binding MarR family transcriptional regulator
MPRIDAAKVWALNYRLVSEVIVSVAPQLAQFDLDPKELFILAAIDGHPHPAALADTLCMPKPTVTLYLKRLEAANFVRREIDARDLRRHKLDLTAAGRKLMVRGLALLSESFAARLSRLNATEQAQFGALLEKLG